MGGGGGGFYCVSIDSPSFVVQHLNRNIPSQNFTVTLPTGTVREALIQGDSNFPGVGFYIEKSSLINIHTHVLLKRYTKNTYDLKC